MPAELLAPKFYRLSNYQLIREESPVCYEFIDWDGNWRAYTFTIDRACQITEEQMLRFLLLRFGLKSDQQARVTLHSVSAENRSTNGFLRDAKVEEGLTNEEQGPSAAISS